MDSYGMMTIYLVLFLNNPATNIHKQKKVILFRDYMNYSDARTTFAKFKESNRMIEAEFSSIEGEFTTREIL